MIACLSIYTCYVWHIATSLYNDAVNTGSFICPCSASMQSIQPSPMQPYGQAMYRAGQARQSYEHPMQQYEDVIQPFGQAMYPYRQTMQQTYRQSYEANL